MRTPLVTVLIDTYNYGQYVEEAIASVLAQDFPETDREILVVDDGSTDDTPERLRRYGKAITYLPKANGGQASAFNFGLRRARGEIVAFLDADDYWLPGKLQRVVEEFEKNSDVGMVYHQIRHCYERERIFRDGTAPLFSGFLPANTNDLLKYEWYPTSFLAFRRKALEPLLPIPEALTVQADSHLSGLVVFVAPIVGVPECLAVYRIHGANYFWGSGTKNSVRQTRRIQTSKALRQGMKHWLNERDYDLRQPDLRVLLKQWDLAQEGDEFTIAPPGRIRTSRHLMEYAWTYGSRLTWRHRAVNCLNAVGSLMVGYEGLPRLDAWRTAIKGALVGGSKQADGVNPT